ncbi:MAG: hypothetical protein M3Q44_00120 [bacterium]|nr:hypothetical protein [bacterium]
MAALLLLASTVELLIRSGRVKGIVWSFVWPVTLTVIGILFIIHPQHGTGEAVEQATRIHQYLGTALITSGILRALNILFSRYKLLAYGWIIMLAISAFLLAAYKEPEGAYEINTPEDHQMQMQH